MREEQKTLRQHAEEQGMKRKIAAVLAATITLGSFTVATAAPAEAAGAKKYQSCSKLNAKYPGGVAKSSSVRNTKTVKGKKVPAKSTRSPKVSASVYKKNKGLDRDKDGIACER